MKLRPRYPLHFMVALIAACLLWYGLSGQRRENISVRGVKAALTLVNMPRDLVLTSSVPETVTVQVRGPLARALDPGRPLEVLLDLSDARPGLHSFAIAEEDLDLPSEVVLVSVDPARIELELERLESAALPVRPNLEGVPAPGFAVGDVRSSPAQVVVQGPGSRLASLEYVETTPLSIEGATGDIEATLQPRLPDTLLRSPSVVPLLVIVEVVPEPLPTPAPTPAPRRRR